MKRKALVSLFLLIPVPSIGVLFGMILLPDSVLGESVFIASKLWLFALPAFWFLWIERGRPTSVKTGAGGFRIGWISGLLISAFIVGTALTLGRQWIDGQLFRDMMTKIGLNRKGLYLGAAAYWILVNSVLEEYVWRWFVVRQFEKLFRPPGAIMAAGLGFTAHHYLAMQVYFSPGIAGLCALFIFIGGVWWSWMFVRYKTIWPGWLSHALVDVAVFGSGYMLIFH